MILSVALLLLANEGISCSEIPKEPQQQEVQKAALPDLVIEDISSAKSVSQPSKTHYSESAKTQHEADKESSKQQQHSDLIPYEVNKPAAIDSKSIDSEATQKSVPRKDEVEKETDPSSVSSTTETNNNSSQQQPSSSSYKPDQNRQQERKETGSQPGPASADDINILLATKDDAENDLSNQPSVAPIAPSTYISNDKRLDEPVTTIKSEDQRPSGNSNPAGDHFVFVGLESSSGADQPAVNKTPINKEAETDITTTESPKPSTINIPTTTSGTNEQSSTTEAPTINTTTEPGSHPDDEVDQDSKPTSKHEAESETKHKPEGAFVESSIEGKKDVAVVGETSNKKPSDAAIKPEPEEAKPTTQKPLDSKKNIDHDTTTTSTTVQPTTKAIDEKDQTKIVIASAPIDPVQKTASPEEPTKPKVSGSPVETKPKVVPAVEPVKPVESTAATGVIPTLLASSIGGAVGSALGPNLTNKKDQKTTPKQPSSTLSPRSSTSTTAKPFSISSSRSTTRRSSTNHWDRWSTSSRPLDFGPTSGGVGPTSSRRRPILPSIRRRLRPSNRPGAFPWTSGSGNVDKYSPDILSDFNPLDLGGDSTSHLGPNSNPDHVSSGPRKPHTGSRRFNHHHYHPDLPSLGSGGLGTTSSRSDSDSSSGSSRRRRPYYPGRHEPHDYDREDYYGHGYHDHHRPYGGSGVGRPPHSEWGEDSPYYPGGGYRPGYGGYGGYGRDRPPFRPRPSGSGYGISGGYRPDVYGDEYIDDHDYPYANRRTGSSGSGSSVGSSRDPSNERSGNKPTFKEGAEMPSNLKPESGSRRPESSIPSSTPGADNEPSSMSGPRRIGHIAPPNSRPGSSLGGASSSLWPVRSILSPLESLFGALEDDLFGGRSSSRIQGSGGFMSWPNTSSRSRGVHEETSGAHAFDAVVTSPKISTSSLIDQKPSRLDSSDKPPLIATIRNLD